MVLRVGRKNKSDVDETQVPVGDTVDAKVTPPASMEAAFAQVKAELADDKPKAVEEKPKVVEKPTAAVAPKWRVKTTKKLSFHGQMIKIHAGDVIDGSNREAIERMIAGGAELEKV